jgi:WD40 repeat protein/serine/threonine protein kinase
MKICPQCETGYHDTHSTCPTHGGLLSEIRDLKPGMLIRGTYRIKSKLGKGGMGSVYLAQHTLLDEPRALKFLSQDLSEDESFTNRFLHEVRTLRQVRNRNVVDCGDPERAEDDSLFFSMEYVDGPNLREYLKTAPRPFDVKLALHITRGIAEGLGAAHAKGMVHRDIKPENILLAKEGDEWVPKIADFGIVATKESSHQTRTGSALLSMAYAAPEQWIGTRAADLDGRTDLYALGGVLFEMLTGQCAFDAENYHGWAQLHMHTPPPAPSTRRHDLRNWRGLDELVMKMMAKERDERPQNVAELLRMIDAVSYEASRTTVTAPVEADLWGATAVYVPTSGAQPVVPPSAPQQSVIHPPTSAQEVATSLQVPTGIREVTHASQEAATSLQVPTPEPPSGSTFLPPYIPGQPSAPVAAAPLAPQWPGQGSGIRDQGSEPQRMQEVSSPLPPPPPIARPEPPALWQGQSRAPQTNWQPAAPETPQPPAPPAARPPERQQENEESLTLTRPVRRSADGRGTAAYPAASRTVHGGTVRGSTVAGPAIVEAEERRSRRGGLWIWILLIVAIAGAAFLAPRFITQHAAFRSLSNQSAPIVSVAYTADGHTLASASQDGSIQLWDAVAGRPLAPFNDHANDVTFSPDGRTLASADADKNIRMWDVPTSQVTATLDGHTGPVLAVAFSPDGLWLASGSEDKTIRVWDVARDRLLRSLTGSPVAVHAVVFGPGGSLLASAGADGAVRLWDPASGKLLRTLKADAGAVNAVAFSPDGRTLATGGDDHTIKLWDAASGQQLRVLSGHTDAVRALAFSPDGRMLASGGADMTVRLWNPSLGRLATTLDGHTGAVNSVAFSPDSLTVASGSDDRTVRLWDLQSLKN